MEDSGAHSSVAAEFDSEKSYTHGNVLTSRDLVREARRYIAKSRSLVERGKQLREQLEQTLERNRKIRIPGASSSRGRSNSL